MVQQRIVERARQHGHRRDLERVHQRIDLPEPEVPGEQQHPAAVRVRRADPLLPLELDARQHLLRAHRAELQQHRQQPPEVREHAARDGVALGGRAQRKRRLQVADREPPVRGVEPVERGAEQRAGAEHHRHRQQPGQLDDRRPPLHIRCGDAAAPAQPPALPRVACELGRDPVPEPSNGSGRSEIGTKTIGSGHGSNGSSRT